MGSLHIRKGSAISALIGLGKACDTDRESPKGYAIPASTTFKTLSFISAFILQVE